MAGLMSDYMGPKMYFFSDQDFEKNNECHIVNDIWKYFNR